METPEHVHRAIEELASDLAREDEMGAVVRAHIRLENILLQIVDLLVVSPAHLKRMNLDYDAYVSLALALGLSEAYGAPLRAMGSLRNKFAHQLGTSLDAATVNNLYSALAPKEKQQVQTSFARIRAENESVQVIKKYAELGEKDKFQLIAVILWTSLQATLLKLQAAKHA